MKTIKKDSLIPRYAQLKNILLDWINTKCNVGDKIPSERQLTQMFGVSRFTVVRAIKELEFQKFLYSDHGRGTFVVALPNKEMRKGVDHGKRALISVVIPFSIILDGTTRDTFVHRGEYLGVKKACQDEGVDIRVYDTAGLGNRAHLMGEFAGSAVIFVGNWNKIVQKTVPKLRERGIPWCGIGGNLESIFSESCVFTDFRKGAELALEHLLERGYKQIGYCHTDENISDGRMIAFKDFISRKLICGHDFLCVNLNEGMSSFQIQQCAYKAAKERMNKSKLPEAYFCQNDLLACGILSAAKEMGLNVPHELSVVGFDNRPESMESDPALTTVTAPFVEMGREAVHQLKHCINNGKTSFPSIKFSCKLVVRES